MEGLAMTGAWVDRKQGLVSVIILEMGGSSDLCAMLKPGEPVILMGPTGAPTEIHGGETVVLCGGGLGNAVLFSIGAAFRAAGSKVLYFAGYKKVQDRYKVADIENAADVVVWCCDEEPASRRAGRRTSASSATSSRRSMRTPKGGSALPRCGSRTPTG
jgi:NAD(P)H-flavin reductase